MEIYAKDFEIEKEILDEVFESDSKNYHAWSYRVWFIERFNLFKGELEYAESLLDDDVCNNSAWSYRYFIVMKTAKQFDADVVREEIKYVTQKRLPDRLDNESPWVYLRGMLATSKEEAARSLSTNAKKVLILEFPELKDYCLKLLDEN